MFVELRHLGARAEARRLRARRGARRHRARARKERPTSCRERDSARWRDKLADARAHGARGLIVIGTYLPATRRSGPSTRRSRQASYRLSSALRANPTAVATCRTHAAGPVLRALGERRRLTATLTPDLVATPVAMRNVLGIVEGRDPKRRNEMVVVGAHLDHDGTDAEGRIYNGADDNASGTAAVLAAADRLRARRGEWRAPGAGRAVRALERRGKGLARGDGVRRRRPEPSRRVVANLNLDMVGRHEEVPDPNDWRFQGLPKIEASATGNTLHVLGYSYTPDLAAISGRPTWRSA